MHHMRLPWRLFPPIRSHIVVRESGISLRELLHPRSRARQLGSGCTSVKVEREVPAPVAKGALDGEISEASGETAETICALQATASLHAQVRERLRRALAMGVRHIAAPRII